MTYRWTSASHHLPQPATDDDDFEFTIAEMMEMKNVYKKIGEEALDPLYCRKIASRFSVSSNRTGKPAITWQQVHNWFLGKHKLSEATPTPMPLKFCIDLSDNTAVENVLPVCLTKRAKASDLSELIFEAKSSKDYAWYDVASFLNYRVVCSGELEVRVRYAGYRNTDDEWVNLKRAVRERSIPLEPLECRKVKVGDLVLCFRERYEQAVYYDAHVVEIQRQMHDSEGCKCIFLVCYDVDHVKDKVGLEWICRRPEGETNISKEMELPPKSIFF
ncbi:Protein SAWADEE HOMEODOMAIN HOMOLOG 1 [Linum perenne]